MQLLLVGALCLSRLATAAPSVSCNITSLAYNGEYVNVRCVRLKVFY